ncbi:isochorismatase family protein [Flavihumibacter rivuli]|uniref:isochorismatase family protein n=1 Tax=Flavihumibacter rivuli TaxID=2838156 RepID=UPI001BDF2C07|nr:isochorismatase family protein [Flavihumibacter rivuli]ULQ55886.1 isochorismatase family protein [Flavihumibacter rivuli]
MEQKSIFQKVADPVTPENSILLLIDHQSGLMGGVGTTDPHLLRDNLVGAVKAAKILGVPVILTEVTPNLWGPFIPDVTSIDPDIKVISRTIINAWDDPQVRTAIEQTGRKKVLIGAITTNVCLAFPAVSLTAAGYEVHALMDLSGTYNELLEKSALEYLKQGGVVISSAYTAFCQMIYDNARPVANEVYAALDGSPWRYTFQALLSKK